jgi:DNA-binding MarR family transcriptional regulator
MTMGTVATADYQRLLEIRTGLRRFLRWSEERALEAGLTPAQHQLLLAVRGHPGPGDPTVGDVAGHLLLRHHSAVQLVDRAVAAGLLVRHRDGDDHRRVRVALTPDGTVLLESLASQHLEELSRLGLSLGAISIDCDQAGAMPHREGRKPRRQ